VRRFVSRPIKPHGTELLTAPNGGEPPVPREFLWDGRAMRISAVLRTWRTAKTDRGDAYLKRHWFALETDGGATIEVYYDREARRGAPQWWLYTIDE
jgi:hypothetical protein